ncbi:hypothetical protein [Streptomyces sp. NPDC053048]|uniref:hypothetical protein n=1 Tax=Streptomyces sp. NPDC053048 TaxID=3365694 RepID=UPI0037D56C6E
MAITVSLPARKAGAVVLALVATAALGGASAASADSSHAEPARARVTGSAEFMLPYHPDKDVRSFTFDAVAAPYTKPVPGLPKGLPTDARGTVKISHYFAELNKTFTAEGKVDCMVTGPNTATLTAVMTKVAPGGPDWVGKRLGFSVHDGGKDKGHSKDRVGLSWATVNMKSQDPDKEPEMADVGTCMSSAPYAPVTKGGYTVRHAELPPVPKG